MSEERGGGSGRKGKRRYFQSKKENKPGAQGGQSQGGQSQGGQSQGGQSQGGQSQGGQSQGGQSRGGQQHGSQRFGDNKGPANKAPANKARKARRRARSRQRVDDNRSINLEAEVAYVAPKSVYVYEHSVHPELRDAYEFRPDHFSKVGRTLADYQIDLSKLFPGDIAGDGTPVMYNMLPAPDFDWTGWEEEEEKKEEGKG